MSEERDSDVRFGAQRLPHDLERRASLAVVSAVSSAAGVDPTDLDPPLYEVIDPDALDSLFQTETGSVTFEYHGAIVNVDHEQVVTLTATDGGEGDPTASGATVESSTGRREES